MAAQIWREIYETANFEIVFERTFSMEVSRYLWLSWMARGMTEKEKTYRSKSKEFVVELLCTVLFIIVEACLLITFLDVPKVITVPILKFFVFAAFRDFGPEVGQAPILALRI